MILIVNKSNWNTVEVSDKSKEIASLLGIAEAKLLRIGNDTSDETEFKNMDKNFLDAKILDSIIDIDAVVCSLNGKKFVRVMGEEAVEYFIVNEDAVPAEF